MPGNADANEGQTLAAAAEHLTRTGGMQTPTNVHLSKAPAPGAYFFSGRRSWNEV